MKAARVYRVRFGPVDTGESTHRDFSGTVQLAFGDTGVTIIPDDGNAVHVAFRQVEANNVPAPAWAHFWRCLCPDVRGNLRQAFETDCTLCGAKRPPLDDFNDDNPAREWDFEDYHNG